MKNKMNKLLCLLLTLSMLLCMLTVFASAAEGEGGEEEKGPEVTLLVNRTYEEGWALSNGFDGTAPKGHIFELDYEEDDSFNYNYFARITTAQNDSDGFYAMSYSAYGIEEGTLYMYISIKTDDFTNQTGGIIYFRQPPMAGVNQKTIKLFTIADNRLKCINAVYDIGEVGNDKWYHLVVKYQTFAGDDQEDLLSIYTVESAEDFKNPNSTMTAVTGAENFRTGITNGIELFRFGLDGYANRDAGQGWCFDNLCMYTTTGEERADVSEMGYGKIVNSEEAKTETILSYTSGKNATQYLSDALIMKVNVDYALERNKREALFNGEYGAPVKINGQVYLPLVPLIDYFQYSYNIHADEISYDISSGDNTSFLTLGREFASVNGERIPLTAAPAVYTDPDTGKEYAVIAMEDVEKVFPGYYVTWDDMGLIVVSDWCETDDNGNVTNTKLITREKDIAAMLVLMKKFIYDYPTGEEVYEDVKKNTNNFERPYMMARQSTFDNLHAAYIAKEGDAAYDANLKLQLDQIVAEAYGIYKEYSNVAENGDYLGKKKTVINPYDTEEHNYYGYDPDGGRLNESAQNTQKIMKMAMAYQITRDIDYAKAAYDYMVDMGNWKHWGPGHFLNCADATTPYALAFDWLYNVFKDELGVNTFELASYLYGRGVYEGYCSVANKPNLYGRTTSSALFSMTGNNWNAVCTAGTTIGALAIMPYSVENGYPECAIWDEHRNYLIENNLFNLANYGLNDYIPDGSYVEGTGYWAYATNNVFLMSAALDSAAGDNYGYMDTWALDNTCYYALHTETNPGTSNRPYQMWNYHDGDYGPQDTSLFNYVSQYYGDEGLAAIRSVHIANGKTTTVYDLLYYKPIDPELEVELPLDYHMQSIDGAASRSSWTEGALYAGIIAGKNSASHGDIDSGTFMYENNGIRWFYDFGSEAYNAYGYFSYTGTPGRFNYFRKNAEGQNVVFMTSMQNEIPYGQTYGGQGKVVSFKSNEYGSATVIDNTDVYGGYAISAKRGMLMTNNRTTVVIQDEITLNSMQRLVWTAITASAVTISTNGKTAYLAKNNQFVRVTLISANANFKFTTRDCVNKSNYFLDATNPIDSHLTLGGVAQYGRSDTTRLVIDAGMVAQFNVAVVIEYLGNSMQNAPDVGYSWVNMNLWQPVESHATAAAVEGNKVIKTKIVEYANRLEAYKNDGSCYASNLSKYYDTLVQVDRINLAFTPSEFNAEQNAARTIWLEHVDSYNSLMEFIVEQNSNVQKMTRSLCGIS